MSTPNTKRDQLIAKLKEMFQMDQADLDFGIYAMRQHDNCLKLNALNLASTFL